MAVGIFDVYFVATEKASAGDIAKTLFGSGIIVNVASTPVFWTTDILKNAITLPFAQFNSDIGMPFFSPTVSARMNLMFDVSEVAVASIAASIWTTAGIHIAALPVQNVVAHKVLVADNAIIAESSNWKIPNPRDESAMEEKLEWAA